MSIRRVTLFKIIGHEDQQKLISIYKTLPTTALKDGKPYIKSVSVGAAKEDQRSQGYTVVGITAFASLADMQYYDSGCEAHQKLKAFAKPLSQGTCMVYFEETVDLSQGNY